MVRSNPGWMVQSARSALRIVASGFSAAADARADRIEFHARHVRFDVFGDAGHEIAGAAPGFQHLDGRGPDVERVPHGLDHWSGRVVGGQCGGARLRVLIVVEQFADLGVQVGPFGLVGECVRASAPSRVSAQRVRLLRGERLVAVPIERLECPNGGDVRFGAFAGRRARCESRDARSFPRSRGSPCSSTPLAPRSSR